MVYDLGKLSYFTNLNLAAIKGDDSHQINHDFQWGRTVRSWCNLPRYIMIYIYIWYKLLLDMYIIIYYILCLMNIDPLPAKWCYDISNSHHHLGLCSPILLTEGTHVNPPRGEVGNFSVPWFDCFANTLDPIGSMVLVYMLTWLGYIDGKCYHI